MSRYPKLLKIIEHIHLNYSMVNFTGISLEYYIKYHK